MKIFRELENIKIKNPVLTIGTYDGVHLGHVSIIEQLKQLAKKNGGESVIFTFENHPRKFLFPDQNIELLHTNAEKVEMLEKIGLENLILKKFDRNFANLSYEQFISEILIKKVGIKCLVVGFNHQFGKNREGNFENLKKLSVKHGFSLTKLEAFNVDSYKVSSSKIRNALKEGRLEDANKCLGYNYSLTGKVVAGKKIGRKIGYPTANIEVEPNKLIPKTGVYAVDVKISENKKRKGMLNIGFQPTVQPENQKLRIEVNIFDFEKAIYGEEITVLLKKKIRDEKKFEDIQSLKKQIELDRKLCQSSKLWQS